VVDLPVLPSLAGTYSATLVAVSLVVAALASYVALVLASRVIAATGRARLAWLLAGAVAMGTGIWAMHFVGMLAFRLDNRPITYDAVHLILSVLVAIAASGFAFAALVKAIGGNLTEREGSRVAVTLQGRTMVIHKPHPRPEIKRSTVRDIRDFLFAAGVSP
jgi:NO-binding membrane sensor protein with MHYT domain